MNIADKNFRYWLDNIEDKEIRSELEEIADREEDIEERFGRDIEFGTAGLRGIMQSGNNRINVYTVGRATQGLINYMRENKLGDVLAVSYDSRRNSKIFAEEVASVGAANGIEVYITKELAPTPFLSYLVREIKASAGVMITASHNTAEYNGYKCYGSDGAQMNEAFAGGVYEYMQKVDMFQDVKHIEFEEGLRLGLIHFVGDDLKEKYIDEVLKYHGNDIELSNLKVVYTPLNGTGNKYVVETLRKAGLRKLYIVESQENPDENFTTCRYPNPEKISAFNEAIKVANTTDAEVILATDPDADRLGVCIKDGKNYRLLSGNEIGILLTNYILEIKEELGDLPKKGLIIKTIVSTMMVEEIGRRYNCEARNVLTGFKNIASEMADLESKGELNRYLFGFEESNGYLCGAYVRDKDGISASLLTCEAIAYYRRKYDKNLVEMLEDLYSRYGYYGEKTISYDLKKSNSEVIMQRFRSNSVDEISGYRVHEKKDYLKSESKLKSNVLEFLLESGIKVVIRPSGTEPKLKVYIMTKGSDAEENKEIIENVERGVSEIVGIQ